MSDSSISTNSIRPLAPSENSRSNAQSVKKGDTGFLDQLNALQKSSQTSQDSGFTPGVGLPALKFSNHAVERMQNRGIRFSPEQMGKIEAAVSKAASKGAKDTLLLTDEAALIVSVKDKTVVTVMDKSALKENVFTNIDSTVMV